MSASVTNGAEELHSSAFALFSACLLIFVALCDAGFVGAITPQIATGLGSSKAVVAASVTLYSIAAASVALWLGKVSSSSKTQGLKPGSWLPNAAFLFAGSSIIAFLSPHISIFLLARAATGVASGLISALAIAALANASSYDRRGKQMIGPAICYFLAPVFGVPMAAFLTATFNWRIVFVFTAFSAVVAGLFVLRYPLPNRAKKESEVTSTSSSLYKMATRSRSTTMGIVGAFFVSGGLVGFTTYIGIWLSEAFGAGLKQVGLVYGLAGIFAVVGGALGGILADLIGKRTVAAKASILMAVSLLILPSFNWSTFLLVLICIVAFTAALRVAPLQALISEQVAPTDRAAYIALRNASSQLGIASSVACAGLLYPNYGFPGVGAVCAFISLIAWSSIELLKDPAEKAIYAKRGLIKRMAISGLIIVVVIVLGFPWLATLLLTKARTRPDERSRTETPANYGATFEEVWFTSIDGNKLAGWYLPSNQKQTTLVMTHGLFRSRHEMLRRAVDFWRDGYSVLLYDVRRHGKSSGEFSTMGYNERKDVIGAVTFAKERAPSNNIVLMGVSMGAAATLMAAAESNLLTAVIAESSFFSFEDVVRQHLKLAKIPPFPVSDIIAQTIAWRMNFAVDDFNIKKAVEKINIPILFIGGSEDVRMPNSTTLEPLFAAAKNPLKAKYIVERAKHGQAYETDPTTYRKRVIDFLQSVETEKVVN